MLFWVLASLIIFVTSFIAFLLAPLVLTVVVGGGMWLKEVITDSNKAPARGVAPSLGLSPDQPGSDSFRFGAGTEL